jgi:SNF2 family DNA or RNA helicase
MDMRTGKTRTALAYLHEVAAKRILVICPVTVASVWEEEIVTTPIGQKATILVLDNNLSVSKRAARIKALSKTDGPTLIIVNHEAWWREALRNAIGRWEPDAIVVDEAQRIKNRGAKQSRFLHLLADHDYVRYKLALTGTPITKGLENVYSIYRFIDKTIFGDNWYKFSNRYLTMGGFEGKEIVSYQNTDEAEELIAQTSYRITREECFDLPPRQDIVVPVPLQPKTIATYLTMLKGYISQIEGTDEAGNQVRGVALARIVLTAILRLQQITSGHITLEDDTVATVGDEKEEACCSLVADIVSSGEKVVIFCRFRPEVPRLAKALKVLGIDTQLLLGGMSPDERNSVIVRGKWIPKAPVLISQIKAGSLGISMSAASSAIFYSVGFSLDEFKQAKDRLHGADQLASKVGYYHLLATLDGKDTVDHKVYRTLQADQEIAHALLRDPGSALKLLA